MGRIAHAHTQRSVNVQFRNVLAMMQSIVAISDAFSAAALFNARRCAPLFVIFFRFVHYVYTLIVDRQSNLIIIYDFLPQRAFALSFFHSSAGLKIARN